MTRAEITKFLGELLVNTRFAGAGKHWASEIVMPGRSETAFHDGTIVLYAAERTLRN